MLVDARPGTRRDVRVTITDDGPGFPPELIARLGEPYLTTRLRAQGADADQPGGLGLGIFIAKTLLERTGAAADLRQRRADGARARVAITWPRAALEVAPAAQTLTFCRRGHMSAP